MRRMLVFACLVLFSASPARAADGWFAAAWQGAKACAAVAADRTCAFAAEQGKRISEASDRAMQWVQQSAAECTPEECVRHYGMSAPSPLDENRPLVVFIHGLDSGPEYFDDLSALLERQGCQVARFEYPNDQPLADSARLFAGELGELRAKHSKLKLDCITHSMGGLVARSYVEGPEYAGGIERLILLAPPNHGSSYGRWTCCSEMAEHFSLWRSHPRWHWSWPFIDGVGEAGDDLHAASDFLTALNAQPRREEVRYTIVAGNRSCGWRYAAAAMRLAARCVPECDAAADDAVRDRLSLWAAALREHPCHNDGLVAIDSARLEGVDDFVVVPGDHTTIACSREGREPAAWPVIKERLSR